MKILATFLIVLFSLTTQAQTKPKQPKSTATKINAKVISYEMRDSIYIVHTDKGIDFYSDAKPKIGQTIRISTHKK
jgi:hypothetical protein